MRSNRLTLIATLGLAAALPSCEAAVRNCPLIYHDPSSNIYQLEYELLIPADCPIPLANPGAETKYAAATLKDGGVSDFYDAIVSIRNSKGEEKGRHIALFVGPTTNRIAELRTEYVAATGRMTFDDHDIGIFSAASIDASKRAEGQTKLTYQQASLSTMVAGNTLPLRNTSHTWTAHVTGGVPAYTYSWYRDGQLVSTASTYTASAGTDDFDLKVDVTDQTWSTVSGVLRINVDGIRSSITGPPLAWPQDPIGNVWTASVAGGYGPYTYTWYIDSHYAGTGSSFYGYPGDGDRELRVVVADAAGALDAHEVVVHGLGSSDGTCDPEPGQIECEG